jgi:hypothetical protein
MFLDLLEVADFFENCHLRQIARTYDGLSGKILGDNGHCFGSLDAHVVAIENIDWQFERIASRAGFYYELANRIVEHILDHIVTEGFGEGELERVNLRVLVELQVCLQRKGQFAKLIASLKLL